MTQPAPKAPLALRPGQYLAIFKRWWALLVLVPLLVSGGTFWLSTQQQPLYRTEAALFIDQASSSASDISAARLLTRTYSELLTSQEIIDEVIAKLELDRSAELLQDQITVNFARDTQVLAITVEDPDPVLAIAIANTLMQTFVDWFDRQQGVALQNNTVELQERISQISAAIAAKTAELADLRAKRADITAADTARTQQLVAELNEHQAVYRSLVARQHQLEFEPRIRVVVAARARLPLQQISPQPLRDAVIAFGLCLGLLGVAIVLFEQSTGYIYSVGDLQGHGSLSIEAVPSSRGSPLAILSAGQPAIADAYRMLCLSIRFAAARDTLGVIVVSGPHPGGGKSLVAANLAVALAHSKQRVILVDADLRQPSLHHYFELGGRQGLAQVLTHGMPRLPSLLLDTRVPNLRLLAAGEAPLHPDDLLAGETVTAVLEQLRAEADVVIVDTPPLPIVSDALFLAAAADHVLVVVDSRRTRLIQLQAILDRLHTIRTNLLGIVVYGGTRRAFRAYRSAASLASAPSRDQSPGTVTENSH